MEGLEEEVDQGHTRVPITVTFDLSGQKNNEHSHVHITGDELKRVIGVASLNIAGIDSVHMVDTTTRTPVGFTIAHGPKLPEEALDASSKAEPHDDRTRLNSVGWSTFVAGVSAKGTRAPFDEIKDSKHVPNPDQSDHDLMIFHHVGIPGHPTENTLHVLPSEVELSAEKSVVDKSLTPTWKDIRPDNISDGALESTYKETKRMLVPATTPDGRPNGIHRLVMHNSTRKDNKFLEGRYSEKKLKDRKVTHGGKEYIVMEKNDFDSAELQLFNSLRTRTPFGRGLKILAWPLVKDGHVAPNGTTAILRLTLNRTPYDPKRGWIHPKDKEQAVGKSRMADVFRVTGTDVAPGVKATAAQVGTAGFHGESNWNTRVPVLPGVCSVCSHSHFSLCHAQTWSRPRCLRRTSLAWSRSSRTSSRWSRRAPEGDRQARSDNSRADATGGVRRVCDERDQRLFVWDCDGGGCF